MAEAKHPRKGKTPGSKIGDQDFITSLSRNEEKFQTKMQEIFKKYDNPFYDDILINIEDFTYSTPEGRCRWDFGETKNEKMSSVSKHQNIQISCDSPGTSFSPRSKKKLSTTSKVSKLSDQACTTLIQYKENHSTSGHRGIVSAHNYNLRIIRKTIRVASPFKASQKVKRLIDTKNKASALEYPRRYCVPICETDDSGPSDNMEAGNKTLQDFYPQGIEKLCSLWNLQIKYQAASNIVRYYKRFSNSKNKVLGIKVNRTFVKPVNKTYTVCPAPTVEETAIVPKTCNSTLFLNQSGLGKPIQVHSPSLFPQKFKLDSAASPIKLFFDSPNMANKIFEGISVNRAICKNSPFPGPKEIKPVIPPGLNNVHGLPNARELISSSMGIANINKIDIDLSQFQYCKDYRPQQNIQPMSRRRGLSDFPVLRSHKTSVAKPNCSVSGKIATMTAQSQMEVEERSHASYKEYIKHLQDRPCTVARRNSFSAFPMAHDEFLDFESLHRNPTQAQSQSFATLDKGQVQLSKTVSSLVNSPGSLRAKKTLNRDFSMSKVPRNVNEALIGTSKPCSPSMNNSDQLWSERRCSPLPYIVASALPTHMLSHSPVSHRSFSPGAYGESPKRNASRYRKLIYEEN